MRIAIVATARRLEPQIAEAVLAFVAAGRFASSVELVIDPRSFDSHGHFAGSDGVRAASFLDAANDPAIDAVWFARGGYGSARILDALPDGLAPAARDKIYLGYSDCGSMLSALANLGCNRCAHGPLVADIARSGGEMPIERALGFLTGTDLSGLEPSVPQSERPQLAFNLTVLRTLIGTDHLLPAEGAELMIEDVGEYDYAVDRTLWQLSQTAWFKTLAGIRIGRFSNPLENDIAFEYGQPDIVRHWAGLAGVPILGTADIGHDAHNRIVPFGRWADWRW